MNKEEKKVSLIQKYSIQIDYNEAIIVREVIPEFRIIPGKAEVTLADSSSPDDFQKISSEDCGVIFSECLLLKLGQGRENIRRKNVDLENFKKRYFQSKQKDEKPWPPQADKTPNAAKRNTQNQSRFHDQKKFPEITFHSMSSIKIASRDRPKKETLPVSLGVEELGVEDNS